MAAFNPNLSFFLERMSGFSTNTFSLMTENKTTATSSDIISFTLPSNAIVNLKSIKLFCNASANNGTTTAGARLPCINELVERCEVSIGGVIIQGANFTNVLHAAKRAVGIDHVDSVLGHPAYVRKVSYVDATSITTTANEVYAPSSGEPYFAIDHFEGFISTAAPGLLDTSLLSEIKIRLYLASDNVLTTSAGPDLSGSFLTVGAGGARYILSNLAVNVECVSLADATYDQMLASMISSQSFLEIPYKSFDTFQETHTGATRFNVSSASLARIWLAWRDSSYNTQQQPRAVQGYKRAGAFVAATSAGSPTTDIGIPQYDNGGVLDTNREKYNSAYFDFDQPTAGFKAQLQLNGAFLPMFSANVENLWGITANSLPGNIPKPKNLTLDQYKNNYCVQAFRLNMPGSEGMRLLSGLDCRQSNLSGLVRSEGVTGSPHLTIFVESDAVLRVSAGRAIAIIS